MAFCAWQSGKRLFAGTVHAGDDRTRECMPDAILANAGFRKRRVRWLEVKRWASAWLRVICKARSRPSERAPGTETAEASVA